MTSIKGPYFSSMEQLTSLLRLIFPRCAPRLELVSKAEEALFQLTIELGRRPELPRWAGDALHWSEERAELARSVGFNSAEASPSRLRRSSRS